MPICIECSFPVSHLYTTYSRADDRTLGKGVRLTQCPRCKRFADKYVEHDYVVIFIDLVLIKPQVYRHLLFNRLGRDDNRVDRSIVRLGILLLLFDVYLTWAHIEKSSSLASTPLSNAPVIIQYLFFLTLNGLATFIHHVTVRLGASILVKRASSATSGSFSDSDASTPSAPTFPGNQTSSPTKLSRSPSGHDMQQKLPHPTPNSNQSSTSVPQSTSSAGNQVPLRRVYTAPALIQPLPPPSPPSPSAISTALVVSSCPKLFPILLVIWGSKDNEAPENGCSIADSLAATQLHMTATTSSSTSPLTLPPSATASAVPTNTTTTTTGILQRLLSFTKLPYDISCLFSFLSLRAANAHLVLLNNIEALYILLDCGYLRAVALAVAGQLVRWTVEKTILMMFGIR
ncbi:hypothetical protein VTN31DRAFT_3043 [Thermomyces dupontii]|uniref:uncharacterized protein n=1 Tax=Talaromyces thermophilus TaxID=28565 RepID=UPI0037438425